MNEPTPALDLNSRRKVVDSGREEKFTRRDMSDLVTYKTKEIVTKSSRYDTPKHSGR